MFAKHTPSPPLLRHSKQLPKGKNIKAWNNLPEKQVRRIMARLCDKTGLVKTMRAPVRVYAAGVLNRSDSFKRLDIGV